MVHKPCIHDLWPKGPKIARAESLGKAPEGLESLPVPIAAPLIGRSFAGLRCGGISRHRLASPLYWCAFATGGVPWVWKLSMVFSPQAWPFLRSASVQTTVGQSGSRISRAPALAISTRLPAGSQT